MDLGSAEPGNPPFCRWRPRGQTAPAHPRNAKIRRYCGNLYIGKRVLSISSQGKMIFCLYSLFSDILLAGFGQFRVYCLLRLYCYSGKSSYRPSRPPLPSFPRKRESRNARWVAGRSLAVPSWIPAYAGMTVVGRREGRFQLRLPCRSAPGLLLFPKILVTYIRIGRPDTDKPSAGAAAKTDTRQDCPAIQGQGGPRRREIETAL